MAQPDAYFFFLAREAGRRHVRPGQPITACSQSGSTYGALATLSSTTYGVIREPRVRPGQHPLCNRAEGPCTEPPLVNVIGLGEVNVSWAEDPYARPPPLRFDPAGSRSHDTVESRADRTWRRTRVLNGIRFTYFKLIGSEAVCLRLPLLFTAQPQPQPDMHVFEHPWRLRASWIRIPRLCLSRRSRRGPFASLPTTRGPPRRHQHPGIRSVSAAPPAGGENRSPLKLKAIVRCGCSSVRVSRLVCFTTLCGFG